MSSGNNSNQLLTSEQFFRFVKSQTYNVSPIPLTSGKLHEKEDLIATILNDDKNYNLIAPMNSGKTYTLIKIAATNNIKCIMVMPLQVMVLQKEQEFREKEQITLNYIFGGVEGHQTRIPGTSDDEIKNIMENNTGIVLCVYNSLKKIMTEKYRGLLRDYVLIIDESHNMVTQYSFRRNAINEISEGKSLFRKTINISGTPEFTILDKYNKIIFSNNSSSINLSAFLYKKHNGFFKLFNFLLSNRFDGKVVVLLDNKFLINVLQKLLAKYLFNGNSSAIAVTDSGSKLEETFQEIQNFSKIPNEIKYLITTRVIADGVNIENDDIDAVIIFETDDYALKRQFIARFRKGIKKRFYDFVKYKSDSGRRYSKSDLEIDEKHKDMTSQLSSLRTSISLDFQFKSFLSEEWKISKESIAFDILSDLHKNRMFHDPESVENYYRIIPNYSVVRNNIDDEFETNSLSLDFEGLKSKITEIFTGVDFSTRYQLKERFLALFTLYYCQKNGDSVNTKINSPYLTSNYFDKIRQKEIDLDWFGFNKIVSAALSGTLKLYEDGYPLAIAKIHWCLRIDKHDSSASAFLLMLNCFVIGKSLSEYSVIGNLINDYPSEFVLFDGVKRVINFVEQSKNGMRNIFKRNLYQSVQEYFNNREYLKVCRSLYIVKESKNQTDRLTIFDNQHEQGFINIALNNAIHRDYQLSEDERNILISELSRLKYVILKKHFEAVKEKINLNHPDYYDDFIRTYTNILNNENG